MKSFLAVLLSVVALSVFAQTPTTPPPGPAVTIRWGAVTTMVDGTPVPTNATVSYNLYGGHNAAGPWSAPIPILGTSTIRYGVDTGPLCYEVTAVVNGVESLPTAPFCLNVTAVPATVPSAPTNVQVTQNQP
jgi:hypothetical protein